MSDVGKTVFIKVVFLDRFSCMLTRTLWKSVGVGKQGGVLVSGVHDGCREEE